MLNKPKFMSPSINMYGNTVVDLDSETLPFSCIVDGNEKITDFQIVISRLKDNVVVYDTGMQKLDTPFLPVNNRNQNVVFSRNLKDYPNIVSDTNNFTNSSDEYYWTIVFKNTTSGTEVHSTEEVFYANSKPTTIISYSYNEDYSNPSEEFSGLQKRKIYFKSTYSQAEGVSLKRYGWRLTDTTNNVVVMDTISKNQIYGVAEDISCICNGLVNQTEYLLELYIETQNGYFDVIDFVEFDVNYSVKSIDADFEIVPLDSSSGILLNWGNLRTTEGVVIGDGVSYKENFPVNSSDSINIPKNTEVVFKGTSNEKNLEIDENSYVVLSFQFDKSRNTTLFEMSGFDKYSNSLTRKLEYIFADNKLKYTVMKGDTFAISEKDVGNVLNERSWYIATLYPLDGDSVDFKLEECTTADGLFPEGGLYPSSTSYPYFGKWNKMRNEVD